VSQTSIMTNYEATISITGVDRAAELIESVPVYNSYSLDAF